MLEQFNITISTRITIHILIFHSISLVYHVTREGVTFLGGETWGGKDDIQTVLV